MTAKELLTAEEAASILKVSRRTILKWAREHKIESVKLSRKVILFTPEALERFLSEKTRRIESPIPVRLRHETRSAQRLRLRLIGGRNRS